MIFIITADLIVVGIFGLFSYERILHMYGYKFEPGVRFHTEALFLSVFIS